MKLNYLLPHKLKKIGWLIFIPSAIIGLWYLFNPSEPEFLDMAVPVLFSDPFLGDKVALTITNNNILDEILMILTLIGLLLIAFSKEEIEDEFLAQLRLKSLAWATIFNYAILIMAIMFIYNLSFLNVLVYNMFTILLFFIIRFNWEKRSFKNSGSYEE